MSLEDATVEQRDTFKTSVIGADLFKDINL